MQIESLFKINLKFNNRHIQIQPLNKNKCVKNKQIESNAFELVCVYNVFVAEMAFRVDADCGGGCCLLVKRV